jgi:hypothetical protein
MHRRVSPLGRCGPALWLNCGRTFGTQRSQPRVLARSDLPNRTSFILIAVLRDQWCASPVGVANTRTRLSGEQRSNAVPRTLPDVDQPGAREEAPGFAGQLDSRHGITPRRRAGPVGVAGKARITCDASGDPEAGAILRLYGRLRRPGDGVERGRDEHAVVACCVRCGAARRRARHVASAAFLASMRPLSAPASL